MEIRQLVGLNVQRFRPALGLSQEQLAFKAEIHRTYISGVERGVRNITVTVVAKIAVNIKVRPHQLLEPLPKARSPARPEQPAARRTTSAAARAATERTTVRKPR